MTSNGITLISNFTKVGQLLQKLIHMHMHVCMHTHKQSMVAA